MNSLHPVVNLGSFYWNPELLPRDELAGRLRAARALMKQHGWTGLLVFGDCAEPGALAWLTNVCPRMRWTAALVTAQGEPILVVPGAVRDFPMTAVMTPYTDIRSWGNVVKILTEWVQGLGAGGITPQAHCGRFGGTGRSVAGACARTYPPRVTTTEATRATWNVLMSALSSRLKARMSESSRPDASSGRSRRRRRH